MTQTPSRRTSLSPTQRYRSQNRRRVMKLVTAQIALLWSSFGTSPSVVVRADNSAHGLLTTSDAYKKWTTEKTIKSKYTSSKILEKANGDQAMALHWKLEKGEIHLGVAVVDARGWVGLGVAEMGGMSGSDIVVFEAAKPKELQDMHGIVNGRPLFDDQQDWTFVDSFVEDGLLAFEGTRKLDTGDSVGDWPIGDDSNLLYPGTKLIAAWGDTDEMQYHGAKNRLQASVRFFGDASTDDAALFQEQMKQAEGSIEMKMDNALVNERYPTFYEFQCFTITDLIQKQGLPADTPVHLIGFEWLLEPGDHVHHIALYSSPTEKIEKCDPTGPHSFMHVWNKGQDKNYFFPEDVGMLLADESENAGKGLGRVPKSFRLELHYENPNLDKGSRDSSGVRLHYTTKLRQHTGAIMEFGDPRVLLRDQAIGEGLQRHSFSCPDSCTTNHVQPEGLTVLYEMLHMHMKGLTMQNVHKRDGKEIRRSSVQYFDFDQGAQVVKQEQFKVLPGDSFETHCNYNGTKDLSFGFEAKREMCMAWLLVYPAADVHLSCSYESEEKGCSAPHERSPIRDETLLSRTFGTEKKADGGSNKPDREPTTAEAKNDPVSGEREENAVKPTGKESASVVLLGKSAEYQASEATKTEMANEGVSANNPKEPRAIELKQTGQDTAGNVETKSTAPSSLEQGGKRTTTHLRPKQVGLVKVGASLSFLLIVFALAAKWRKSSSVAYKKLADGETEDEMIAQTEEGSLGTCPVVVSSTTVRRRAG